MAIRINDLVRTVDLTDSVERSMLADELEVVGRTEEAELLRSSNRLAWWTDTEIGVQPDEIEVSNPEGIVCPVCKFVPDLDIDERGRPVRQPCEHLVCWSNRYGPCSEGEWVHPAFLRFTQEEQARLLLGLVRDAVCRRNPCRTLLVRYGFQVQGSGWANGVFVFCDDPVRFVEAQFRKE